MTVNSMPNCTSNGIVDMYADDTTLSVSGATSHEVEQMLNEVMTWITKNGSSSIVTKHVS